MSVPLIQQIKVASYIIKKRLAGKKKYPLVLMLEPLFRCNLACGGCGKIDYPSEILNKRLSLKECLDSVDECGAPIVSIPGGEPLLHSEIGSIVSEIVKRKKFVYLCTNALLMEKKLDLFSPSVYFTFSVHLDGNKEVHDKSVCQSGVYDRALSAISSARDQGFRVNINCTIFDDATPKQMADFFDSVTNMGIKGITISPGFAYERAPDQDHFLRRSKTKEFFRQLFSLDKGRKWPLSHSSLYLDFLAGNQKYHCTPWGNPTRNVFGWQKPCYLLGEGYAATFKELMSETDWDLYGTGKYEKCNDCMAHCGYEATAVSDAFSNPIKALKASVGSINTKGPLVADIDLHNARPAEYMFEKQVGSVLENINDDKSQSKISENLT